MMILENKLLLKISNIAISAGLEAMKFYNSYISVDKKLDNSPITKADLASNDLIKKELKKIEGYLPILTEESLVDWSERKKWNKYWLVDPLDGTKEFINKNGEFTINISLIENNKPILGVIYAPALSVLYCAQINFGSLKIKSSNNINNFNNSKIMSVSSKNKVRILTSRSHANKNVNNWIDEKFKKYELVEKGSSLKFCEIADGNADIYPRFGPTSEWDIAAGHIILEEAGGFLRDIKGNNIIYNTKASLINPEFIAFNNSDLI
tara:strand:- start:176 stop:970 length:795 start_codon:yes stop_codon:yes gene_type:complete